MEVQDEVGGDPTGPCEARSCFTGFPKDKTDTLESGRGWETGERERPGLEVSTEETRVKEA